MFIINGENRYMFNPKYREYLQNIYNSVSKIKEIKRHKDRKSGLRERMKGVLKFWKGESLEIFRILITWVLQRKSSEKRMNKMRRVICGNKMPTRCNRGFYCRSYCLLNMFRAPLYPSSGAQEYYTVVAACGVPCCGFQVAGLLWSWGLCVRFAWCCSILQIGHITLSSTADQQLENHSTKHHRQQPLYNTLKIYTAVNTTIIRCW